MKNNDRVYLISENKFGIFIKDILQSGFTMHVIDIEGNENYYYKNDVIETKDLSNIDLWRLAENNILPKSTIIQDADGIQLIYTGKSFQLYYSNIDLKEKYIGMCKGDKWTIIDIDESEL